MRFELDWDDKYASLKEATARVRNYVRANPGAITRDVTKKAGGKETLNREALRLLVDSGDVVTIQDGTATRHHLASSPSTSADVAVSPPYIGGDGRRGPATETNEDASNDSSDAPRSR